MTIPLYTYKYILDSVSGQQIAEALQNNSVKRPGGVLRS